MNLEDLQIFFFNQNGKTDQIRSGIFLYDNANPYSAQLTQNTLAKLYWKYSLILHTVLTYDLEAILCLDSLKKHWEA